MNSFGDQLSFIKPHNHFFDNGIPNFCVEKPCMPRIEKSAAEIKREKVKAMNELHKVPVEGFIALPPKEKKIRIKF
jgi:hypothetical protein